MKFRIKFVSKVYDALKNEWKWYRSITEIETSTVKKAIELINRNGNVISAEIENV